MMEWGGLQGEREDSLVVEGEGNEEEEKTEKEKDDSDGERGGGKLRRRNK
jgi:hypothetical protein